MKKNQLIMRILSAVILIAGSIALTSSPARADDCATSLQGGPIYHYYHHEGTNNADVCDGTSIDDEFDMKDGPDVVQPSDNTDNITAGNGDDELHGGGQGDNIGGNPGDDKLSGGDGGDNLTDGANNDWDKVCDGYGDDSTDLRDSDGTDKMIYKQDGINDPALLNVNDEETVDDTCPFA